MTTEQRFVPPGSFLNKMKGLVEQKKQEQAVRENPPKQMPIVLGPRPGRNEPCPCGSGKKYKKCCLAKQAA